MKRLLLPTLFLSFTVLGATAVGAEPFPFRPLPADKCVLQKVDVVDTELRCLKMINKSKADCAKLGGTTFVKNNQLMCDAPNLAGTAGPTLPTRIKDKEVGGPGPYDAGSQNQAKIKDPKGCVLRPDSSCDKLR